MFETEQSEMFYWNIVALCIMFLDLCMLTWVLLLCSCQSADVERVDKRTPVDPVVVIMTWLDNTFNRINLRYPGVWICYFLSRIAIDLLQSVIHPLNNQGQNVFQRALKCNKMHPSLVFLNRDHSFIYLQLILCVLFFNLLVITSQLFRQNEKPHQPHR